MNAFKRAMKLFQIDSALMVEDMERTAHLTAILIKQPDFTYDHVPMEGWPNTVHKMVDTGIMRHIRASHMDLPKAAVEDGEALVIGNYAVYTLHATPGHGFIGSIVLALKIPDQRIADGTLKCNTSPSAGTVAE